MSAVTSGNCNVPSRSIDAFPFPSKGRTRLLPLASYHEAASNRPPPLRGGRATSVIASHPPLNPRGRLPGFASCGAAAKNASPYVRQEASLPLREDLSRLLRSCQIAHVIIFSSTGSSSKPWARSGCAMPLNMPGHSVGSHVITGFPPPRLVPFVRSIAQAYISIFRRRTERTVLTGPRTAGTMSCCRAL